MVTLSVCGAKKVRDGVVIAMVTLALYGAKRLRDADLLRGEKWASP
jgi:hypothetical protein